MNGSKKNLIVIDGGIADVGPITKAVSEEQEILLLSENNGLEEVKAYLAAKDEQYDVIHFITHGSGGVISINGENISSANLKEEEWAAIGSHLADGGDLLFYGCEIAKTAEGKRLVDAIAKAANADAAASIDLTGKDGDWELEYVSGSVESRTITVAGYDGKFLIEPMIISTALTCDSGTIISLLNFYNIEDTALTLEEADVDDEESRYFTVIDCLFNNNEQGIYRDRVDDLTISQIYGNDPVFKSNASRKNGAGIYTEGYWDHVGSDYELEDYEDMRGGLTINAPSATFQCNVAGNDYAVDALYIPNLPQKTIDPYWILWQNNAVENSRENYGGAIYGAVDLQKLDDAADSFKYSQDTLAKQTINNTSFSYNAAIGGGGAVVGAGYMWYVFNNCSFDHNGAGVNSYISIAKDYWKETSAIRTESKTGKGGAILLDTSSWAEFNSEVTFSNNRADIAGGALCIGTPHEDKNILKILLNIVKLSVNVATTILAPEAEAAKTASKAAKKSAKKTAQKTIKEVAKFAADLAKDAIKEAIKDNGDGESAIHSEMLFHENSVFENNSVLLGGDEDDAVGGGAIFLEKDAIAMFEKGISFSNNTSSKSGGAVGLYLNSIFVTADGVDCTGNIAGDNGGAFSLNEQAVVMLGKNSVFTSNSAVHCGGAVYTVGKEDLDEDEHRTMVVMGDGTFENNSAAIGGAAYFHYTDVSIYGKAIFQGNSASNGGAVYSIYSDLSFNDTADFSNNKATAGMGGALYLSGGSCTFFGDVSFTGNTAFYPNWGNAIYGIDTSIMVSGKMTLDTDQSVILDGGCFIWDTSRDGIDVYVTDYSLLGFSESVTKKILVNDIETTAKTQYVLAGNASNAAGQSFWLTNSDGASMPIFVGTCTIFNGYTYSLTVNDQSQLVLNIVNLTATEHLIVATNQSLSTDGVFENYNFSGQIGGVVNVQPGGLLDLYDCTLTNNSAEYGGAIYNYLGNVYLENVTFNGNTATVSTASGAIYNQMGTIKLTGDVTLVTGTDIIANVSGTIDWVLNARSHGYLSDFSKVYTEGSSTFVVSLNPDDLGAGEYKLASNAASANAKSFIVNACETTVNQGNIEETITASAGLTVNGGVQTLTDFWSVSLYTDTNTDLYLSISANTQLMTSTSPLPGTDSTSAEKKQSSGDDEVIHLLTKSVYMPRITVSEEYSIPDETEFDRTGETFTGNGGMICVESTGTLTNEGTVTFANCSATENGGGIYNTGSTALKNASFSNNSAANGGAVANVNDGSFTLNESVFSDNRASGQGGAVYHTAEGGILTLRGVKFSGNTAENGGAIYSSQTVNIEGKVTLRTKTDTFVNDGVLNWNLAAAAAGSYNFAISDWSLVSGSGKRTVTVNALGSQLDGTYTLAKNVDTSFDFILYGAESAGVSMSVAGNGDIDYYVGSDGRIYELKLHNDTISFTVENHIQVGDRTFPATKGVFTIADGKEYECTDRPGNNVRGDVFYVRGTGTLTNGETDTVTFTGCNASIEGGAIASYGTVRLHNAAFTGNNTKGKGGAVYISTGKATFIASRFISNSAANGGAIVNEDNNLMILTGVTFTGNTATENGGAISNLNGGKLRLDNVTFSGNTAEGEGGAIYNEGIIRVAGKVNLAKSTDTIVNNGTLNWSIISGSADKTDFAVSDWSKVSGDGDLTITVGSSCEQYCTSYKLAENAGAFSKSITVKNYSGTILGTVSTEKSLVYANSTYTLTLADNVLSFSVVDISAKPYGLKGDAVGVTWQGTAASYTVQYSKDSFGSVLAVQTDSCGVDTYALPESSYDWKVKNTDSTEWSSGKTIVSEYEPVSATTWQSDADDITDLFFANAAGKWSRDYVARNVGLYEGWTGTREIVSLTGKNKIADTFTGSDDASILLLTDDENGDALFVDDIYTTFPAEHQARIAQIDEIRAGAGDDVVDLTSQRYEYIGDGVLVRGGDGNDTIWANKGDNKLFGDAGEDRLVGASGNDVLAGGIGNDSMHGGGGDDIFCFCKNWGQDTVEQLSGGSVTLWFKSGDESKWNQDTMTYTDGENSVKVTGVAEVSLIFGNESSDEYVKLAALGAFAERSSEKIYEDPLKTTLASLI